MCYIFGILPIEKKLTSPQFIHISYTISQFQAISPSMHVSIGFHPFSSYFTEYRRCCITNARNCSGLRLFSFNLRSSITPISTQNRAIPLNSRPLHAFARHFHSRCCNFRLFAQLHPIPPDPCAPSHRAALQLSPFYNILRAWTSKIIKERLKRRLHAAPKRRARPTCRRAAALHARRDREGR